MLKGNEFVVKFKNLLYTYLSDLLFFSENIKEDIKEYEIYLNDIDFLNVLYNHTKNISEQNNYPLEIKNNVNKVLTYLLNRPFTKDSLNLMSGINKNLKNMKEDSYDFFYDQYVIKCSNLKEMNENNRMWSKKEMVDSIRFDFNFLDTMISPYNYLTDKTCLDEKCLYAIRRIYTEAPILLENKEFKTALLNPLYFNISKEEDYMDAYNERYNNDFKNVDKKDLSNISKIIYESKALLIAIENKEPLFNYDIIKELYTELQFDVYITGYDIKPIVDLKYVYEYIDGINECLKQDKKLEVNQIIQKKLIDMLSELKEKEKYNLDEYNDHLVKVNSFRLNKDRLPDDSHIKKMRVLEILFMTDEEYNKNRYLFYNDETILILKNLLKEYPELNQDDIAFNRIRDISLNASNKIKKKRR